MSIDIIGMTASELARGIRNGDFTSVQVTSAFLEEISKKNGEINAFITINDNAIKEAELIDEKIRSGEVMSLLMGVPVAVKDNICTKGLRTTAASRMLENFVPPYDATVVKKLKDSGMIILGKTNMDEFGMGSTSEESFFGPVRNPVNLNKVAGGSSGGSAACVKAGMAPIALGSDTGGSIRLPASYCGVMGIKPTYGRVSRYGLISYASSFDQIGVIGKSAEDISHMLNIISARDDFDESSLNSESIKVLNKDIKGLRIGVPNECLTYTVHEDIRNALTKTMTFFESEGASVSKFDFKILNEALRAYYIIACAEASSNLGRYDGIRFGHKAEGAKTLDELYVKSRTEGFGSEVKRRIMAGNFVLSKGYFEKYYLKALKVVELLKANVRELYKEYDVILMPVSGGKVPDIGALKDSVDMYLGDLFTVPVNLLGLPSVAFSCGVDREGLPVGLQLVGDKWSEELILSISNYYGGNFHE